MATVQPKGTTKNMDILVLVRMLNRIIEEVAGSASAGVNFVSGADLTRLQSYITAVRALTAHFAGQPPLDLPETHPKIIELPNLSGIPNMENDALFAAALLIEAARDELIRSASSAVATNISTHDLSRFTAIMDKADSLVNNYILVATPIDLPESSPRGEPVVQGL